MEKKRNLIGKAHPHLTILEDISALISLSQDLQETLESIVTTVRDRMETEVCSLYILDQQRKRLTLRATMGLDQESVGKVSMGIGEGLTGLVIERMKPTLGTSIFQKQARSAFTPSWAFHSSKINYPSESWLFRHRGGASSRATKFVS